MLSATQKILDLYDNDEFKIFIIEGDHGFGKSSYAFRVMSEVYSLRRCETYGGDGGKSSNWNLKMFKDHIGFHPSHVLDIWMAKRKRDYCFVWDDSGLWLNAMDYQDPFVKEVGKYLQVARSDWACILFTCIDKEDVVNKVRTLRHAITIDINKNGSSAKQPNIRTATGTTTWKSRKGRTGFNYEWEERYDCWMPQHFYDWYLPLRNEYSTMAKKLMKDKLEKKKDIMAVKIDI